MVIKNKVVYGGPALNIPAHLSFGQYILDKFTEHSVEEKKIALVHGDTDQVTTYRQLLQEVVSVANGLKSLGVKRGDIVAICSENRLEFMFTAIGIILCGATVTTLSPQYAKGETKHVLNISKPTLLIASEAVLKQNLSVYKEVMFIKRFIQMNGQPIDNGIISLKSVYAETDPFDFEAENVKGAIDTVFLLYSSGTTGLPKGVMLTHVNALYAATESQGIAVDHSHSCYLTVVPWYHAYGLMTTINYLTVGKTMVYFPGFYPEKYLRAIEKYKVNVLFTVPPIIVFLTKSPLVNNYDVSSVSRVWCAAAPLSTDTIRNVMKRLPNCEGVLQGYGMTETSTAATKDVDGDTRKHKPGSGGPPLPGVKLKHTHTHTHTHTPCPVPKSQDCELLMNSKSDQMTLTSRRFAVILDVIQLCEVNAERVDCTKLGHPPSYWDRNARVVDVESRKRLGPMETGEICIKGPVVMKGYMEDESANRGIIDEEGFLKTGDIGYYDHDGYIFIVDRIKELIKYKGHQVAPAAVESVVLQHSGVAECGVVGAPDDYAGELPTAFVVVKPGSRVTARELIEFAASRLSPANHLHGGVIFVKEIPKNPSGKILRRVLKQNLQKKRKSKL
ncbi:unnamed protein product, partial [Iphiclides podalirius]